MNHKAECLQIIPVPNRSYYETRTVCVCGLTPGNFAQYSFESSFDDKVKISDFYPSDKESDPKSQHLE